MEDFLYELVVEKGMPLDGEIRSAIDDVVRDGLTPRTASKLDAAWEKSGKKYDRDGVGEAADPLWEREFQAADYRGLLAYQRAPKEIPPALRRFAERYFDRVVDASRLDPLLMEIENRSPTGFDQELQGMFRELVEIPRNRLADNEVVSRITSIEERIRQCLMDRGFTSKDVDRITFELPERVYPHVNKFSEIIVTLSGIEVPLRVAGGGGMSFLKSWARKTVQLGPEMNQILSESVDIIRNETGLEIGKDLTLKEQQALIGAVRSKIIPRYASPRTKILFREDGSRDYADYGAISHHYRSKEGIKDDARLALILREKGGVCGELSELNTALLSLYHIDGRYISPFITKLGFHAAVEVVLRDGSVWVLDSNLNGGYFVPAKEYVRLQNEEGDRLVDTYDMSERSWRDPDIIHSI